MAEHQKALALMMGHGGENTRLAGMAADEHPGHTAMKEFHAAHAAGDHAGMYRAMSAAHAVIAHEHAKGAMHNAAPSHDGAIHSHPSAHELQGEKMAPDRG